MWGKGTTKQVRVTAKTDIPKGKPLLFVWTGVYLEQHVEEGPVYSDLPPEPRPEAPVPLHDEVTDEFVLVEDPPLGVEE